MTLAIALIVDFLRLAFLSRPRSRGRTSTNELGSARSTTAGPNGDVETCELAKFDKTLGDSSGGGLVAPFCYGIR